jgi:VWFA-related protein
VLIAAVVLAGQDLPSSQTPFRAATDLIPVDVSVLDGSRRPVRGLSAADFTVLEDGQPRPVVAFSEVLVPVHEPAAPGAAWLREAPHEVATNTIPGEGRLVAILMDRSIPRGEPMLRAQRIAAVAVDELGPGDLAAVVRSSDFTGEGLEQGFTSDQSRLRAAIESPAMGLVAVPQMTRGGLVLPSPVPHIDPDAGDCYCGMCVYETLRNVALAMREAPRRRKQLLFVGSVIELQEHAFGEEDRECYGLIEGVRRQLFEEIDSSHITVHVLDPAGLMTFAQQAEQGGIPSPVTPAARAEENRQRLQSLRILPDRTGGRLVTNTNDPEEHVPAIFDESRSYYLLGFEPASNTPDGRLHRIDVRVNDRNLQVRSRTAYRAGIAADSVNGSGRSSAGIDRAQPADAADRAAAARDPSAPPNLDALLDGPLPRATLPLSVSAAPLRMPARRQAALALVLGADLPGLPVSANRPAEDDRRLAITAAAFDDDGGSVAVTRRMMTMPVDAVGETGAVRDGLVARLDVPPGRYDVRVAVRDEASGAAGTVFTTVEVPDFVGEALTLSGVLFRRPTPLEVADSPLADLVAFTPTAERTFSRGEAAVASVRVYQGGDDMMRPVRIATRIVDASGTTAYQEQSELPAGWFGTEQESEYDVVLPTLQLAPGSYLLTIEATLRDIHRARDVRFFIR